MRLNKNLKSILILVAIVAVFFAWEYYHNKKSSKELITKFEQENCLIILEGYKFGITKEEFDKLYPAISDSLKYSKMTGYTDRGKIIKTFHGINVKQSQFCFADNIFSGTLTKASFFTGIALNLMNVTNNDVTKLRTIFTNSDWDGNEYFNDDGSFKYSYQWNEINDCVGVTLIYEPSKNKAYINFEIREEIIYQY
ncbi:MAG: hypothetical protein ACP5DQ_12270 [Bacteroidales bacterium]